MLAKMMKEISVVLLVFFAIAHANKYTESKCTKDKNGEEFCQKLEEEEEEEPCFYEDPKESLFQWDPIEVCILVCI